MRIVIQRVLSASVSVADVTVGAIDHGLLILLGVADGDTDDDLQYILDKTIGLRIFKDDAGKMNLSVEAAGGQLLVVSQFTLLADTRKGKRPGFAPAAAPDIAQAYYKRFMAGAAERGLHVQSGQFGADMQVSLVNDGPVTIILDSKARG